MHNEMTRELSRRYLEMMRMRMIRGKSPGERIYQRDRSRDTRCRGVLHNQGYPTSPYHICCISWPPANPLIHWRIVSGDVGSLSKAHDIPHALAHGYVAVDGRYGRNPLGIEVYNGRVEKCPPSLSIFLL
jgi:hypothetical protein